jgi:hypothetical protein
LIYLSARVTLHSLVHQHSTTRSIACAKCIMSTPVRSPVVLLVQRNDDAEMYAEFLTHAGVTPITASNAVDAFDAARRSDIVVTGIRLSGELT